MEQIYNNRREITPVKKNLYTNAQVETLGESLNVKHFPQVVLNVKKCLRSAITVEVSNDGTDWTQRTVSDMDNGENLTRIFGDGKYLVDVQDANYVRVNIEKRHHNLASVSADISFATEKIEKMNRKQNANLRPYPFDATVEKFTPIDNTFRVRDVTAEGTLYGSYSRKVVKTSGSNYEEPFVELYNNYPNPPPVMVKKLDNGTVIAGFEDGKIILSDTNEKFEVFGDNLDEEKVVLQMPNGHPGYAAYDVYKNMIILGEYGSKPSSKVWISWDYGETFTEIFDLNNYNPIDTDTHIHGITYDRYDDIIWLIIGDTLNDNVFWSNNWGQTWNQVYTFGEQPLSFSEAMPLPNCVLFSTDSTNVTLFKWDRTKGIDSSDVKIKPAYTILEDYNVEPIMSTAFIDYDNPAVYFSYTQMDTDLRKTTLVYGTADGEKFYPIYNSGKKPSLPTGWTSGWLGIPKVVGKDSAGNMYCSIVDENIQILKIKIPEWKSY